MAYSDRLFPPQFLTTVMPTFVKDQGCRVYFSLSNNRENEIKQIHVTVTDQRTNISVLSDNYKSNNMIKFIDTTAGISIDEDRNSEDKYFITIEDGDIKGGFKSGIFYKVQVRFSTKVIAQGYEIYLQSNQSDFSEWSTVCLIRSISSLPIIYFPLFGDDSSAQLQSLDLELNGYILFADGGDQQKLNSFFIKLYDDANRLIEDSGEIKVNQYYNSDKIKYKFKTELLLNKYYTFTIQILTNFYYQFEEPKSYTFEVVEPSYPVTFQGDMDYSSDSLLGRIEIHMWGNQSLVNLIIKRTSSESNFKLWELVHKYKYTGLTNFDYTWYDYTVKSGVYYKYAVHIIDGRKHRVGLINKDDTIKVIFDHIYLLSDDKQLCVKFNPQITSYTYNVAEGKTDTIGSQYPYFRKNGNLYYRQFPLTGTITHFMDIKGNLMQASRKELYRDSTSLYLSDNASSNITPYEDLIYERDFRLQVIDFLLANTIKLFRSNTLGNILIKISDINFTPNQTLGRMIYDFSCTCYEIQLATFDNIKLIGIITNSDLEELFEKESVQLIEKYGQLIRPDNSFLYVNKQTYFPAAYINDGVIQNNIVDLLYNKYQTLITSKKDTFHKIELEGITYFRIEMIDKPYLINLDTMTEIKDNISPEAKNTALGYIIYINGFDQNNAIFISPQGRYEFSDSNTDSESKNAFKITSIYFPKNTQAIIDYKVNLIIGEDLSKMPISLTTKTTIGQLFGTFDINDSIYRQIYKKYYYKQTTESEGVKYTSELRLLSNIKGIRITGRPGLAFAIKDIASDGLTQYTYLNNTGTLEFYDAQTGITLLYFLGYHLDSRELRTGETLEQLTKDILKGKVTLRKEEYFDCGIELKDLFNSKYMINNLVVTYKNKKYIYYDFNWYVILNNIVQVPKVEAMIDYFAEITTKRYTLS